MTIDVNGSTADTIERYPTASLDQTINSVTNRGVPHLRPTVTDKDEWMVLNQERREQGMFD